MSQDEFRRYRLSCEVLEGKLTIGSLTELLGKSYRQTQRIVANVKSKDVVEVYHGNCGKIPFNKTPFSKEQKSLRF